MEFFEELKTLVLRQTGATFNEEIADLIESCRADLASIGVEPDVSKPLIRRAVKVYCRLNFGEPDDYDRLKRAYDELRAQLQCNTAHRRKGEYDGSVESLDADQ